MKRKGKAYSKPHSTMGPYVQMDGLGVFKPQKQKKMSDESGGVFTRKDLCGFYLTSYFILFFLKNFGWCVFGGFFEVQKRQRKEGLGQCTNLEVPGAGPGSRKN